MINQKQKTIEAATGKWREILMHFGIDEKFLTSKHCACPVCGGSDRFRFDNRDGSGSFFCGGCGSGYGMDLLMRVTGWQFPEAAKNIDGIIGNIVATESKPDRSEADKIAAIQKVWKESVSVTEGDPVWLYLTRRTGITQMPTDVRYHSALWNSDDNQNHPAMVSLMRDQHGKGLSLHRTYLTFDGNKAQVERVKKFMPGKPLICGAIRLFPMGECLGISEGIESALSAAKRFRIPVWAASNDNMLANWIPPEGVKRVIICADQDSSYAGQAAAYALAKRLVKKTQNGIAYEVEVLLPPKMDTDWNDYAESE